MEFESYDSRTDTQFSVHKIIMMEGSGTHMDAPAEINKDLSCIAMLKLENLIAHCIMIDVSEKVHARYSVSAADIIEFEKLHGKILENSFVIIRTGWDKFWAEPKKYQNNHIFPNVSINATELLLERNIKGLGIDTLSPDRPEDGFPVHKAILSAGKYIIENVAHAHCMPCVGGYTIALPIKIKNSGEAPIRLIGLISLS